ncbi:MAG TPA: hypothetical protein VLB73_04820, partial [Patescibacteria group bacterium]|nr:hypothetical protein [Patescibacteria group bacterium]
MKDFLFFIKNQTIKNKVLLYKSHKVIFYSSFILIPIIFFLLSYISSILVKNLSVLPDPFPIVRAADYPFLQRTFQPIISAQAAYILDDSSKVVLFAKNDTVRFSPASTTKMMTALTALDYYKPNDIITIKRSGVEPVVVGFPKGAKVKFSDMLYAMLLPSGNDCALALADNYPGGESAFVDQMNRKAKLLHLDNTHFGDPVGLVDDEDYSTVRDMALLAAYTKAHPVLSQIVATKEKLITDSTGTTYDLKNTNKLLGLYGVTGVKTGYTGEAGEVLATSATIHGHTFILVVMKSDNRFADTE